MLTAIALQLFPSISSFELKVEVVAGDSSAQSGGFWDSECWNWDMEAQGPPVRWGLGFWGAHRDGEAWDAARDGCRCLWG